MPLGAGSVGCGLQRIVGSQIWPWQGPAGAVAGVAGWQDGHREGLGAALAL